MLNTIIRTSRSSNIEESLEAAIVRLDMFRHHAGQPVIIRYLKSDRVTVNTLFAIGIKEGVGKDRYSLVSTGGEIIVNRVLSEIPDVTDMVNGELYLCKNNGYWNYLSLNSDGTKKFDPNIPSPRIIKELKTGYRWFIIDNSEIRREDDFVPSGECSSEIYKDMMLLNKPTIEITNRAEQLGTNLEDPEFDIQIKDYSGQDISNNVDLQIKKLETEDYLDYKIKDGKLTIKGNYSETVEFEVSAKIELLGNTIIEFKPKENLVLSFVNPVYATIDDETPETPYSLWDGKSKLVIENIRLTDQYIHVYIPKSYVISDVLNKNCDNYISEFNITEETIGGIEYNIYTSTRQLTETSFIVFLTSAYIPDIEDDFDKKLLIYNIKKQAIIEIVPIELTQDEYDRLLRQGLIEPDRTYLILKPEED